MTQQRYHTRHYDSQSAQHHPQPTEPSRRFGFPRTQQLAPLIESGPQAGDISSLRVVASRKLRCFDVDGPSPLLLSLNGEPVVTLRPGQNPFDPPLPLSPGDVLQLEVLEDPAMAGALDRSGWNPPAVDAAQPAHSR